MSTLVSLVPLFDGLFQVEGTSFVARKSNGQILVIGVWDSEAGKVIDVPEHQLLDAWLLGLSHAP